jgi:DNA-binding NarL/FixJ family response regulator
VGRGNRPHQPRNRGAAARLFGAPQAVREAATGSTFLSVSPAERATYDAAVVAVRTELGDSAFADAWTAGRDMQLQTAVEFALERDRPAHQSSASATQHADPLTKREREVATLLVRGLTNRQIASELVISEGTARIHVEHILAKLGFRSRAQVAAWAVEHGLLPTGLD